MTLEIPEVTAIRYFVSPIYGSPNLLLRNQFKDGTEEKRGLSGEGDKVQYVVPTLPLIDERVAFIRGITLPVEPLAVKDREREYLSGSFTEGRVYTIQSQLLYTRFSFPALREEERETYQTIVQIRTQPLDATPKELVDILTNADFIPAEMESDLVKKLRLGLTRIGIGRVVGKANGGTEILDF